MVLFRFTVVLILLDAIVLLGLMASKVFFMQEVNPSYLVTTVTILVVLVIFLLIITGIQFVRED